MKPKLFILIIACAMPVVALAEEQRNERYKGAEEALDRGNRRVTDPQIHELDELQRRRDSDETVQEKINRDIDRQEILQKQDAAAERAERKRALTPRVSIDPQQSALATSIMAAVHARQRDLFVAQEELNKTGDLERFDARRREIDDEFERRLEELLSRYDINLRPTTNPHVPP